MEPISPKTPLGHKGRILIAALLVELAFMWSWGLYSYALLPEVVPTHFDTDGEPTAYGEKTAYLIMLLALSIAPITILLLTSFRFALLNRHQYLINLPAFYFLLTKLPFDERGRWVNRYFEAVLLLGCGLNLVMIFIELETYKGAMLGRMSSSFLQILTLAIAALLAAFIYYLRALSMQLKAIVEARSPHGTRS